MHMDPLLPMLVASIALVLLVAALAKRARLPHVVSYLAVGILLGPSGLHLFQDEVSIRRLGEFGVILLLFFAGMEVNLPKLVTGWKISILGTILQVLVSLGVVALLGWSLDWPMPRIVLFGFAISLSSTALVISMLRQWGEMETPSGIDALGILLVQDVAVVGMLIVLGMMSGETPQMSTLLLQLAGAVGILVIIVPLARGAQVWLPFGEVLRSDHELQVFAAFGLCFGLAWITALLSLSSALGAFVAGLVVAAARETDWVHRSLEPYRVLLVATFFVSVGMMLPLDELAEHWVALIAVVLAAFATNTLINAAILRGLGRSWRTSFYVGALLSQIGEFSFVLAAVGLQADVITLTTYQLVIGVIAGTLLLGPAWVALWRPFRGPSARSDLEIAT
ncbi:MAG: CPA2 family monovalent cation:H+ antiporter-2 [Candidatus Paceibacteria bacterium]|jgi:CPA2 family monovalent cation:H+ antiporter-2